MTRTSRKISEKLIVQFIYCTQKTASLLVCPHSFYIPQYEKDYDEHNIYDRYRSRRCNRSLSATGKVLLVLIPQPAAALPHSVRTWKDLLGCDEGFEILVSLTR